MLTPIEKVIFVLAMLTSGYAAFLVARRIYRIVQRGHGGFGTNELIRRLINTIVIFLTQKTVLKRRLWPSIAHAFIAWAFAYFLLANLADVLQALIPNFIFLGTGRIGNAFRIGADLLGTACLIGVVTLMVRRWVVGDRVFGFRGGTLIHPKAVAGIKRDSTIVSLFILVHVSAHILGDSVIAYRHTYVCGYVAVLLCGIWGGVSPQALGVLEHLFFWGAIGTILGLAPYFLISKHIHIFMAPINFLLEPDR